MKNVIVHFFKTFSAPEGKRSSGLTAVWVARNRFAVLDRMHSVSESSNIYLIENSAAVIHFLGANLEVGITLVSLTKIQKVVT